MIKRINCAALTLALLPGCSVHPAVLPRDEAASVVEPHAAPETGFQSENTPEAPPQKEEERRALELPRSMTLEEKAGQMFLAHYAGENAAVQQTQFQFGGYILFAGDFNAVPKDVMTQNIKALQDASKIKMLIGVDEEGGSRDDHTGIAYDNRSLENIRKNDLKPFAAGIAAGVDCILVAHNIVSSIDEKNPAFDHHRNHRTKSRSIATLAAFFFLCYNQNLECTALVPVAANHGSVTTRNARML